MDHRFALLRHRLRRVALPIAGLLLACTAGAEQLPPDCGDLGNHYGPYDYTNPSHFTEKLPVVEQFHFSREQELSTFKPNSKEKVDFDYTLRAFPNHHRALMSLVRWLKNHDRDAWQGRMRAECYFYRALAWRPRDSVARMIFALYLHQNQRLAEAEQQYQNAVKIQPDYAEAHYNLGLLYADQKRWPEALASAHRAYALNYPLPGLKKRLLEAKAWREPAPAAAKPAEPTESAVPAEPATAAEPTKTEPPAAVPATLPDPVPESTPSAPTPTPAAPSSGTPT